MAVDIATLEAVDKLRKDTRAAAADISDREARYLVDAYYTLQDHRIEAQNQVRALDASEEPNDVIKWLFGQHKVLEDQLSKALDTYSGANEAGAWARSITGVGPIIAAGLLAHIDITKAPTVGHIWRFAGLDPTVQWNKGEKRPWNAALKVLCFKVGESFVKVSGRAYETADVGEGTVVDERAAEGESTEVHDRPGRVLLPDPAVPIDLYAWLYARRKLEETAKNAAGAFADQAAETLERKRIGKDTEAFKAYSQGRLPAARIHARARRYAVKLFLAHFHHVLYVLEYEKDPPMPYVITHLGHTDYMGPPNWPMT